MKIIPLLSLSLASALLASPTAAFAAEAPTLSVSVTAEEAVGPFASWGDVKAYGAVGDGKADDTDALQRALDDMNKYINNVDGWKIEKPGSPAVLYFPAGTYRITKTLVSKNQFGASLVGQNPATSVIAWDGPAGGTMLIADGVFGGKYARLTWDGRKKAGIGVAHWWNKKTPQYGASPEHVDEVFVDMGVGIVAGCCGSSSTKASHPGTDWVAGEYNNLDSEGSVKRTKFIRNTVAGVSSESFNALDWWVMDSEFTDCARGVTNALVGPSEGGGNIHVYRNLFQRSTFADIHVGTVRWHSMHNNVSVGSQRFLHANLAGRNGRALILKNNRILNHRVDSSPISSATSAPWS
ncbi:glycoside hydrolase family 55 protein [Massilia antarctica]|uniref:glycoside hydrolase family 55 protein n=1 Tax=Massilia antarctica TaxID=2765360 RepID=UPI001E2A0685|nr:glycoside hydrolase family 55 protein [Massilia antarctica]